MLVELDARTEAAFTAAGFRWPGLSIISGFRTKRSQLEINPSAPNSLHTFCGALAADLRVGSQPATLTPFPVWQKIGGIWKRLGGRWGGDFTPTDPNHFECRNCAASF